MTILLYNDIKCREQTTDNKLNSTNKERLTDRPALNVYGAQNPPDRPATPSLRLQLELSPKPNQTQGHVATASRLQPSLLCAPH